MSKVKTDHKGRKLKEGELQEKNKRYRYRYTDQDGVRRTVYAWRLVPSDLTPEGKKEDLSLREKEKIIAKDLEDGIKVDDGRLTLNQLFDIYISTKVKLADTTVSNYIGLWNRHVKCHKLGEAQVKNIKKSDILKFYAYLYKEKDFKVGTLQLYQNILFPTFQVAVDDDIIRKNPCVGCMKEYTRHNAQEEKQPLSREAQCTLLKFLKEDATYYPMFSLVACMLGTGMRIGEALGLTWKDINLEDGYIDVNHQLLYKNNKGKDSSNDKKMVMYITQPKNNSCRRIPIKDDLIHILREHKRETYFMSHTSEFKVDGYSDFVFINRDCKPRTPNTVNRSFNGMVKAYNKTEECNSYYDGREPEFLPTFSAHTLRHTYCTRMAENGTDVKVLQTLMGHKNITVTMQVYNHSNFERVQKEVDRVKSVINL